VLFCLCFCLGTRNTGYIASCPHHSFWSSIFYFICDMDAVCVHERKRRCRPWDCSPGSAVASPPSRSAFRPGFGGNCEPTPSKRRYAGTDGSDTPTLTIRHFEFLSASKDLEISNLRKELSLKDRQAFEAAAESSRLSQDLCVTKTQLENTIKENGVLKRAVVISANRSRETASEVTRLQNIIEQGTFELQKLQHTNSALLQRLQQCEKASSFGHDHWSFDGPGQC
jgi:hypothetical protein